MIIKEYINSLLSDDGKDALRQMAQGHPENKLHVSFGAIRNDDGSVAPQFAGSQVLIPVHRDFDLRNTSDFATFVRAMAAEGVSHIGSDLTVVKTTSVQEDPLRIMRQYLRDEHPDFSAVFEKNSSLVKRGYGPESELPPEHGLCIIGLLLSCFTNGLSEGNHSIFSEFGKGELQQFIDLSLEQDHSHIEQNSRRFIEATASDTDLNSTYVQNVLARDANAIRDEAHAYASVVRTSHNLSSYTEREDDRRMNELSGGRY